MHLLVSVADATDVGSPPLDRRDKEDEEPEGTYHDQCVMAAAAEEAAGAWGEGGAWGAVEAQRRSRPLMRSGAGTSKKGQMTANRKATWKAAILGHL